MHLILRPDGRNLHTKWAAGSLEIVDTNIVRCRRGVNEADGFRSPFASNSRGRMTRNSFEFTRRRNFDSIEYLLLAGN